MLEFFQTVLALIVTLSILVTIHEFGHYWVARLCNVHVIRFSIGFGKPYCFMRGRPPVIGADGGGDGTEVRTRSNEPLEGTEFAIAAIPLGGYVKMLDEREGFVPDDWKHLAFNRKSVWQRIAIVSAGPVANFLLAIVAYWMLFVVGVTGVIPVIGGVDEGSRAEAAGLRAGQEVVAIDGLPTRTWVDVNMRLFDRLGETGSISFSTATPTTMPGGDAVTNEAVDVHVVEVEDWLAGDESPHPAQDLGLYVQVPKVPPVLGRVVEGSRADVAGLQADDEIYSVNGIVIGEWSELVEMIQASPEQPMSFALMRQGSVVTLEVVPGGRERDGETFGYIGVEVKPVAYPDEMMRRVSHPFYLAWVPALEKTWDVTAFTLKALGKMVTGDVSPRNLAGPITIAQVANDTAESGFESFVGFIALLSISLGVINLLPIPVLDGGHLLYFFIEAVAGRPVPEKVQTWGLQIGMFLIASIMLLALFNDFSRL